MTTIAYDGIWLATDLSTTYPSIGSVAGSRKIMLMDKPVKLLDDSAEVVAAWSLSGRVSVRNEIMRLLLISDDSFSTVCDRVKSLSLLESTVIVVTTDGNAAVGKSVGVEGWHWTRYTRADLYEKPVVIGSGSPQCNTLIHYGISDARLLLATMVAEGLDEGTGTSYEAYNTNERKIYSEPTPSMIETYFTTNDLMRRLTRHTYDTPLGHINCCVTGMAEREGAHIVALDGGREYVGNRLPLHMTNTTERGIDVRTDGDGRFLGNSIISSIMAASKLTLADIKKLSPNEQEYSDFVKLLGTSISDWKAEVNPKLHDILHVAGRMKADKNLDAMSMLGDRGGELAVSRHARFGVQSGVFDYHEVPDEILLLLLKAMTDDCAYLVNYVRGKPLDVAFTERSFGSHCEKIVDESGIFHEISMGNWSLQFGPNSITYSEIGLEVPEGLPPGITFLRVDWAKWVENMYNTERTLDYSRPITLTTLLRVASTEGGVRVINNWGRHALLVGEWLTAYIAVRDAVAASDVKCPILTNFLSDEYTDKVPPEDQLEGRGHWGNVVTYVTKGVPHAIVERLGAGRLRKEGPSLIIPKVEDDAGLILNIKYITTLFEQHFIKAN